MMSRSKKPQNDVESDSDWDSLPGDVPEPGSSPEPKSPSPRAPAHSPAPPKQPYSKHPTKPVNMYKNPLNPIQKSGSATTFQDRTGGLWNNDDNENDDTKVSKENNNNVKNNDESIKDKKDTSGRTKHPQGQEQNKRPPFTDFRDALSTPIPAAPSPTEQHGMGGVNQAYRLEAGDEVTMNNDSWDESENESQMQRSDGRGAAKHGSMKQELVMDRRREVKHNPQMVKRGEGGVGTMEMSHFSTNENFENCCLIQVSEGAFDDRNRPSFFHGSKNHFHVKEDDPKAAITDFANKSEVIFQRFWREVFGVLQILFNFFIIFVLELFKTIIFSVRCLLVGILYITGDHFIKPLLSATFNNIIQPSSVLLLNVFTIVTNLLKPILALTREILSQVAIPLKAFRLFVWEYKGKEEKTCTNVKVV